MTGDELRSTRIAVVGTGLIGGSILRRLTESGFDAIGWDPDPDAASFAKDASIPFSDTLSEAVSGRDLVFLGGPLSRLPETLDKVAAHVSRECVLTDVGSTKAGIAAHALSGALAEQFIPGHPMAGTENSGLRAADPSLFESATWVLCPPQSLPLERIRRLSRLILTAFGSRVTFMPPDTHDSVVALSSHIPHLLAGTLAGAVAESDVKDGVLGLAAGSFRDGTRVAGTAPVRTVDMLVNNRDAVVRQLRLIEEFFGGLVAAVRDLDASTLLKRFEIARQLRTELVSRPMRAQTHAFPLTADPTPEFDFLIGTGASGSHLTECTADDQQVVYSLCTPGTEAA